MKRIQPSAIVVCLFAGFAANADQSHVSDTTTMNAPHQDVMLGGNPTLDACSTYARVAGLRDVAGNFLALRSHPSTQGDMLAKLSNNQELWVCDEQGDWHGVIILDTTQDCGNSSPIAVRKPYTGPCKSGWVYGKFITPLAG